MTLYAVVAFGDLGIIVHIYFRIICVFIKIMVALDPSGFKCLFDYKTFKDR